MMRLYGMTSRNSNDKDGHENVTAASFDVHEARSKLESLISNNENDDEDAIESNKKQQEDAFTVASLLAAVSYSDDNDDKELVKTLPPPPVLTAADRERRLTEIQFLQKLDSNNDDDNEMAVNLLWDLWHGERGFQAKRRLEETAQLMVDITKWKECEQLLQELIEEYGVYYTEPVNRLAILYFLQGRFDESYELCRVILKIKPWHFGVLSGIVLLLQHQRKRKEAQRWAERCLPTPRVASSTSFPPFADLEKDGPPNTFQRKEWVKKAVKTAQHFLLLAEQRVKESLGEPEEYYCSSSFNNSADKSTLFENTEDSAWQ